MFKLLVVDDEAMIREGLKAYGQMNWNGFVVLTVENRLGK